MRGGARVHCWGSYEGGQVGVSNPNGYGVSTVDAPSGSWTRLYGGDRATCGLTTTDLLACWGDVVGTSTYTPTDASDPELHDLGSLSLADDAACAARTTDAARLCWGSNGNGQLGDGTMTDNFAVTAFDAGTIADVALRGQHACALTTAGGVTCWESNSNGESEVMTGAMIATPSIVAAADGPLQDCTAVAVGPDYSCAICDAHVTCWGRSNDAETGVHAASQRHFADLVGLPPEVHAIELALGSTRACALGDTGRVFCWGDAPHGDLGDGSHASPFPIPVGGP